MLSEAINVTGTAMQKMPRAAEQLDFDRKRQETKEEPEVKAAKNDVPAEEMLDKIKALTEDGVYSIRFESDAKTESLIVKIVDSETDEVIRQVPAEELLGLKMRLSEYQGNFIDTTS